MKKWRGPADEYRSSLPQNKYPHLSISEQDKDNFLCHLFQMLSPVQTFHETLSALGMKPNTGR